MIHPLIRFPVKGVVWYQGESNEDRPNEYRSLFPLLIQTWRNLWERELPFYFVQLANFRTQQSKPFESGWAKLREAQRLTLSLPKTGMAVALDVGTAKTVHPPDKQSVGKRLGLIALAKTYGADLVYSGPLYRSMEKKGMELVLSFAHTGSGLCTPEGEELRGFAIAGADQNYRWAEARIEGDKVVLSHPEIDEPRYAAYSWADNPVGNLFNREGLPASSFKSLTPTTRRTHE
jgi:sialate O-acetylesterase